MGDEELLREIANVLIRRKSRDEMIAECLREVGVLLIVFVPLEAIFNPGKLVWWQIVIIIAVALGVEYGGIRVEEKSQ